MLNEMKHLKFAKGCFEQHEILRFAQDDICKGANLQIVSN